MRSDKQAAALVACAVADWGHGLAIGGMALASQELPGMHVVCACKPGSPSPITRLRAVHWGHQAGLRSKGRLLRRKPVPEVDTQRGNWHLRTGGAWAGSGERGCLQMGAAMLPCR